MGMPRIDALNWVLNEILVLEREEATELLLILASEGSMSI
jgi:hypothetical protein